MSFLGATADLLEVARATLREAVLPQLGAEARYEAAMIGNALAIAARELRLGPKARAAERELLSTFYEKPEASLDTLRRHLCRDLRAGGPGPEREAELQALLRAVVHARLAISNPGYAPPSDSAEGERST
jgi:hypothetical protein